MADETRTLADFAVSLKREDIPEDVLLRAKYCFIDTVAACTYGARLPWSKVIAAYARGASSNASSRIIGSPGPAVGAAAAALANGTSAHAFELDTLRRPGAGVHPGAVLATAALALAQERKLGGAAVLTSVVAACEVMFRIGSASRHSSEKLGFHAPGLTGPFGSSVVAGRLLGLNHDQMTNAFGIAGSLSSGLLEFAKSGTGGMVKRLHLGRAAENGIVAATIARDGFTGPATVLEGKYGFLQVFCADRAPERLTAGLGETWETRNICFKRYPCHITAHIPIEAALGLRAEAGFALDDLAGIHIRGSGKMAQLHNILKPQDLIMAQYSVPWCVAAALVSDPQMPETFSDRAFQSRTIMDLCGTIVLDDSAPKEMSDWGCIMVITLRDGRRLELRLDDFPGTPTRPMTESELRGKFLALTDELPNAREQFDRLMQLEAETDLGWIGAA
ncbi:MAG: MmgE/PrpD family protein [Microvirga sp.]